MVRIDRYGKVRATGSLPLKANLPLAEAANVRLRPFPSGSPSSPDVRDDPG
jgi:hypothetical protein